MLTHISQPDEVTAPSIKDTVLVRGPVLLYNVSIGRYLNKQTPEHIEWEVSGGQEEEDEATAMLNSALPPNANAETRKRKAKAKS